ncbi:hypothetical protein ACT17_02320 [Mycolicibacterium conceptionense]|jgi:hypothetical protein|uniref:Uncharacterized protein n=3 Tax=Mycolicibacterium TaxID=1866885 RepID=A0ABR5FN99_9MYCO|nr:MULTISPECIES: hypothetical protein [Mycolicibacterium]KLI07954.1 hypothetical protein AA982_11855 [Mycolicibacterium senegalense]KLO48322.1 hypothetical protein ABW05_26880 [Mycolicibacterium senegalense]KMV20702.1 hypothetical protein ACT17_02320 [Mycolicibacterium conceptionense]OBJ94179.1 hypothetical protein A5639_04380 [Mycolicibacterium conceptionense]OMB81146.1 hypothetical protein A5741_25570 [Mycolicibacterium conceptionense]
MFDLTEFAMDAHGGLDRFNKFTYLTARLVQGGVLWGLKGKPTVLEHANVRVHLKQEWVSHWPFAPTDNHSEFTPQRVTIATPAGEVVEKLDDPRASFAGYDMETPWSDAQVGYFAGYTMWTYLTSPFLLAQPGVVTQEIDPWTENGEQWRRLRVTFPPEIATHSTIQTFYFDGSGLLRRHDYDVDIQGSNPAARYLLDPVTVSGIVLPSKLRIYPRNPDNSAATDPLIVSVDLSDFAFE